MFTAIPLAAAAQQTRRVPQDFPTIQAAINASANGDTVLVAPGTWFENLTIDTKEITPHLHRRPQQNHPRRPATTCNSLDHQHSGHEDRRLRLHLPERKLVRRLAGLWPAGIFLSQAGAIVRGNSFTRNIGYNIYVLNSSVNATGNTLSTAGLPNSPCLLDGGISAYASTGITVSG